MRLVRHNFRFAADVRARRRLVGSLHRRVYSKEVFSEE